MNTVALGRRVGIDVVSLLEGYVTPPAGFGGADPPREVGLRKGRSQRYWRMPSMSRSVRGSFIYMVIKLAIKTTLEYK